MIQSIPRMHTNTLQVSRVTKWDSCSYKVTVGRHSTFVMHGRARRKTAETPITEESQRGPLKNRSHRRKSANWLSVPMMKSIKKKQGGPETGNGNKQWMQGHIPHKEEETEHKKAFLAAFIFDILKKSFFCRYLSGEENSHRKLDKCYTWQWEERQVPWKESSHIVSQLIKYRAGNIMKGTSTDYCYLYP